MWRSANHHNRWLCCQRSGSFYIRWILARRCIQWQISQNPLAGFPFLDPASAPRLSARLLTWQWLYAEPSGRPLLPGLLWKKLVAGGIHSTHQQLFLIAQLWLSGHNASAASSLLPSLKILPSQLWMLQWSEIMGEINILNNKAAQFLPFSTSPHPEHLPAAGCYTYPIQEYHNVLYGSGFQIFLRP